MRMSWVRGGEQGQYLVETALDKNKNKSKLYVKGILIYNLLIGFRREGEKILISNYIRKDSNL